jgi:anhydro-N-acetylmuramic acid kinase
MPSVPVSSTAAIGALPMDVEALAFAWMARQTLRGAASNIPSVTGAHHEAVLGAIYPK